MKVIDAMANKLKSPALLMGFSKLMDAAADCFVTSLSQEQISALVRMQLGDLAKLGHPELHRHRLGREEQQVLLRQGPEPLRHEAG